MTTATERASQRLHVRISDNDLVRIKHAHARKYEDHRKSFSAWVVAVLLQHADRTLGRPTLRLITPEGEQF